VEAARKHTYKDLFFPVGNEELAQSLESCPHIDYKFDPVEF
jgi:hypothetical protein